jgi:hypothetical protein
MLVIGDWIHVWNYFTCIPIKLNSSHIQISKDLCNYEQHFFTNSINCKWKHNNNLNKGLNMMILNGNILLFGFSPLNFFVWVPSCKFKCLLLNTILLEHVTPWEWITSIVLSTGGSLVKSQLFSFFKRKLKM